MNSRKNPASSWKLYPVPNRAHRRKLRRSIWNGVYCIIDKDVIKRKDPVKIALSLFRIGVDIVQLRYKNYPSYKLVRIAKKIQAVARKCKKALLINDRIDVALASGSKGVHLGSGDLSLRTAHFLLNPKSIVGKTVHKIKEAKKANFEKAGYVSAGPVFSTPLKKNLKKQGIDFVKKIKKCVSRPTGEAGLPVFAIGGINKRNVKAVLRAGAGICVTRAIFQASEILKEISNRKPEIKK